MAVIIINLPDKDKVDFQEKLSARNETMSRLMRGWIKKYLSKK